MADRINERELITLASPNTKPKLQANRYTEHQLVRRLPPPSPSPPLCYHFVALLFYEEENGLFVVLETYFTPLKWPTLFTT